MKKVIFAAIAAFCVILSACEKEDFTTGYGVDVTRFEKPQPQPEPTDSLLSVDVITENIIEDGKHIGNYDVVETWRDAGKRYVKSGSFDFAFGVTTENCPEDWTNKHAYSVAEGLLGEGSENAVYAGDLTRYIQTRPFTVKGSNGTEIYDFVHTYTLEDERGEYHLVYKGESYKVDTLLVFDYQLFYFLLYIQIIK